MRLRRLVNVRMSIGVRVLLPAVTRGGGGRVVIMIRMFMRVFSLLLVMRRGVFIRVCIRTIMAVSIRIIVVMAIRIIMAVAIGVIMAVAGAFRLRQSHHAQTMAIDQFATAPGGSRQRRHRQQQKNVKRSLRRRTAPRPPAGPGCRGEVQQKRRQRPIAMIQHRQVRVAVMIHRIEGIDAGPDRQQRQRRPRP